MDYELFKKNKNISLSNIKLDNNGRIFPLWIITNFKKYVLPSIKKIDGVDPCLEEEIDQLTSYQEFIGNYLNYESPFKDILLYHGVGSGKTRTAINIYNILYNYTTKWNIFILIPAALRDEPWMKDINKYMTKENFKDRFKNIIFIHYDSPNADKEFLDKVRMVDMNNKSIFIIDEVHRFIINVYNNIYNKKGKRAQVIYDYIQQEKKEMSDIRIILLSATPVVNNPFEFILIFNLLRPNIFKASESAFEQFFISSVNYVSLNVNTKNLFQRRILGLVSYYIGATPDKYAQKKIRTVNIVMDTFQENIYNKLEEVEKKKEKQLTNLFRGNLNNKVSTYSSYTRQACNFVFPLDGEHRPRPGQFKISDNIVHLLNKGKKVNNLEVEEYEKAITKYIDNLHKYINDIIIEDKLNGYTLEDDVIKCNNEFNNFITNFMKSKTQKSKLLLELYKLSPKFIRIIFNIKKTKGIVLVYSNYVYIEGLEIFKIYLKLFNYISIDEDKEFNKNNLNYNTLSKDHFRYCEFHGSINKETRTQNKNIFNISENKYGKYCKIIMISSAGVEGINLFNIRQVHIMEPYWNEVRIEQVIGRALRYCHHKDLPLEERIVDVYRYKMTRNNHKITTDEKIEDLAKKKYNLLLTFINAVKEAAIDCELFKEHNMMATKYRCFNFNQESLLEDNIGPAYKINIDNDIILNNGLNSQNTKIMRIKVIKIKAVIKINDDLYSEDKNYWYHPTNNVVYDYELNYIICKLQKDENNELISLENNIYIIDKLVNVPQFNIYN